MAYTIISGERTTVERVGLVAAVASASQHAGSGETTVTDGEGAVVATIRRGADLSSPRGLEDTKVDLSETESLPAARAAIRSALGQ